MDDWFVVGVGAGEKGSPLLRPSLIQNDVATFKLLIILSIGNEGESPVTTNFHHVHVTRATADVSQDLSWSAETLAT